MIRCSFSLDGSIKGVFVSALAFDFRPKKPEVEPNGWLFAAAFSEVESRLGEL